MSVEESGMLGGAVRTADGGATLIQIDYDVVGSHGRVSGMRVFKAVAIGMFVVLPLSVLAAYFLNRVALEYRIAAGAVIAGFVIWMLVALTRRAKRRVREFVAAQQCADPGLWVAGSLGKKKPAGADVMVAECLSQMAAAGFWGTTIRVCKASLAGRIDPIMQRFEPVAVDEAEDAFVELMEAGSDAAGITGDGPPQTHGERRSIRRLKSRLRQFGGWSPLLMAAIFSARYFIALVRFGQISIGLVMWTGIIALWVWRLSGSGFRSNQWFAIPGGVAIRRARRGSHEWDVTVIARRAGVLGALPLPRKLWLVIVRGPAMRAARPFTRAEMEMLLRAWLSPLEPPEVGMLSDLV